MRKNQNKFVMGLSLIEVLLGAAVLITVLLSIISIYITCFELVSTSRNMTLAVNGVQWVMEQIHDYDFNKIYTDYNMLPFTLNDLLTDNMGIVYVDNSDPDLLKVTISVCWRDKNNRLIGEDADLDGSLDAGEDLNNNGIIDSPAQLVSLIVER